MTKIHFIAIGGAIMHQLALALQRQGYEITGSDDEITDPAKSNLRAAGLLPEKFGWFPDKIIAPSSAPVPGKAEGERAGGRLPDAIVLGMHARADNPELLAI